MKAEDAIFRIVRALWEVVAHVVSPEGMPGLLVCNDFGCSGQGHAVPSTVERVTYPHWVSIHEACCPAGIQRFRVLRSVTSFLPETAMDFLTSSSEAAVNRPF